MLYVCEIQHSTHIFLDEGIDFKKKDLTSPYLTIKKGIAPKR